jgi:hypothetical protein
VRRILRFQPICAERRADQRSAIRRFVPPGGGWRLADPSYGCRSPCGKLFSHPRTGSLPTADRQNGSGIGVNRSDIQRGCIKNGANAQARPVAAALAEVVAMSHVTAMRDRSAVPPSSRHATRVHDRMSLTGEPPPESDDIELVEMANLPEKYTGIDGIIYISTAQGAHGPRVKWYPGRPGRDAPCLSVTIAPQPEAINNRLPGRVAGAAVDQVKAWVTLNQQALLAFWREGGSWTIDEVNAFIGTLQPIR